MATNGVKKRLISKRKDGGESSEEDIIIDLSDEDSVSVSDSSTESEPEPEQEEISTNNWDKQNNGSSFRTKQNDEPSKSWADDQVEDTKRHYSKPSQSSSRHNDRREKRYSGGFQKRSNDKNITSTKWAHDMFQEDSDDDQSKNREYKPKASRKGHKKNNYQKDIIKMRKQNSNSEFSRNVIVRENEAKNATPTNPELPLDSIKNLSISDIKEGSEVSAAEQPRVRRGISLAAKQQLIASFTKTTPLRPTTTQIERQERKNTTDVPVAPNSAPVQQPHPVEFKLVLQEQRVKEEERVDRNKDKDRRKSRRPDERVTPHTTEFVSPMEPAVAEPTITPEQLHDQLVATSNGWAIVNPSTTLNEVHEPQKEKTKKKLDSKPESRSYKSKRASFSSATPTPIMQPMINVQPMMTQSGHMVLMTESGLCVPATADMFQYQQWYDATMNTTESPYYYSSNYYPEEPEQSN